MTPAYFFRSTLFNICYYILIALSCILLLPTLILPRRFFLGVVHYFVHTTTFLERYILGLKYEIRGLENLPKDHKYIIASKHQSAYETTKLHILFKDPAIVLKRELLKIPLWGWYLAKSDVIAIDRTTPKKAIASIKSEAKRVAAQNRPIIIFPQGTRVAPTTTTKERPYKVGIVRMQEATGLPIIPMALNTGTFYPRNAWIKRPGKVIFEFLKPIHYTEGTTPDKTIKLIETNVEEASTRLRTESLKDDHFDMKQKSLLPIIIIIFLCIAWTVNWFAAAHLTKNEIVRTITNIERSPDFKTTEIGYPRIAGFPFKMKIIIDEITLTTNYGGLSTQSLIAKSWPFLGMPIEIKTQNIEVLQNNWRTPLKFKSLEAKIKHSRGTLEILHGQLNHDTARAEISGTLAEPQENKNVSINLNISIFEHSSFLNALFQKGIINQKMTMLTNIALNALTRDGAARTTITSQENKIYLGLIKIYEIPKKSVRNLTRRPDSLIEKESFQRIKRFKPAPPQ